MPSLWRASGRPFLPLALVTAAAALIAYGLSRPVLTLQRALSHDTYSVLTGILDLAIHGQVLLALVVLVFSVLFPIAKLALLFWLLLGEVAAARRARWLSTLELLGRWSMLDVFVIAILIGSVRLGILSRAEAEPGVYVFGGAILLSMLSTVAVVHLLPRGDLAPCPPRRAGRWLSLLALVAFGVGLALPLMRVEKFTFWDSEYSVLSASRRMLDEDAAGLAIAVLLFVVVVPLARLAVLALLHWVPAGQRLQRAGRALEQWAMLDVFGLALLVVVAKIGGVASVELHAGFWVLLGAGALSMLDAWILRREPGSGPAP